MKITAIMDNELECLIDPSNYYVSSLDIPPTRLLEACGLIPSFLDPGSDSSAQEQLERNYGLGKLYEFTKAWLDSNNWYHSEFEEPSEDGPGEEPLAPLIAISLRDEQVFVYPNAFVAVKNLKTNTTFITRMD